MLIEEIVRSCANHDVAEAAVASIGGAAFAAVADRAAGCGMSVGAFAAQSINRFVNHGDEAELRSVIAAMCGSQEPLLAGLHRILCITLAVSGGAVEARARGDRAPRIAAQLCVMDATARRELHA